MASRSLSELSTGLPSRFGAGWIQHPLDRVDFADGDEQHSVARCSCGPRLHFSALAVWCQRAARRGGHLLILAVESNLYAW